MRFFNKILLIVLPVLAVSCGHSGDNSLDKDVDISQNVIPFELDTISVGNGAGIYSFGSMIVVVDGHAKDKILTIIDLPSLKVKGQIAQFGPGPDEITVPGAVFIDNSGKSISIFDYGQLKIATYDIDSALVKADYSPSIKADFNNRQFPDRYVHVNDSIGFARSITMDPKSRGYSQGLCKYDITTGELTEISDPERMAGLKSLFGISLADSIIAEGATNNDILNIYNFKGELLHKTEGPDYSSEVMKDKVFFREIEVIPHYILASYSGREGENAYSADRIRVYKHDGSYVKTLIVGKNITDMAYNQASNRLFCIFNDENIQFGYIELDDIL